MNLTKAYEVLKIPDHSSIDDIKIAYRTQSLLCHPDRSGTTGSAADFLLVKQAYQHLLELSKFKNDSNGKFDI